MQRLTTWYKTGTAQEKGGRVPPLDGLRFLMVFSVAMFHLWQQSWLFLDFTFLGVSVSLTPWLKTGYMWVDGMLLLSGFLLYLPIARAREINRAAPNLKGFYRRRAARIVPTYLLNLVIVYLLVALPENRYATAWEALRDWLAHLTFTHPLFAFSSRNTPLNGVLWTLGVEMQFYLLFPLFARAFHRMPLFTWMLLSGVAFSFRAIAFSQPDSTMLVNQLPAFLDVYANGFLAAGVFAKLERRYGDDGFLRAFMTMVMAAALMGLSLLVLGQAGLQGLQAIRAGQMLRRFPQSVLTALVLIGASFGLGGVRLVLGNRVTAFLAAISYQFYMWHQVVALQMKKWRFPPSRSETPHVAGERAWQVSYLILALVISLIISTLIAYLAELPLARRLSPKTTGKRKGGRPI